jgi:hypothetical protein
MEQSQTFVCIESFDKSEFIAQIKPVLRKHEKKMEQPLAIIQKCI